MLKSCLTCHYWDMDILKKGIPLQEKCNCKESLDHNLQVMYNNHCYCWTSPV